MQFKDSDHTAPAKLIEGKGWDTFWGQCNGVGENLLGNILIDRRQQLIVQETKDRI